MPTASRTSSPKPKPKNEELRQETVSLPNVNSAQWFGPLFLPGSVFFFFDLGGGFSFPHEASEPALLKFVAVKASQQPLRNSRLTLRCRSQMIVHMDKRSSRQKETRALAQTVAAISLWRVSQRICPSKSTVPEATRRSKVPRRPPGLCKYHGR